MEITETYSHKNGESYIKKNYLGELDEIYDSVKNINLIEALSKISYEASKEDLIFSPANLNQQLKTYLSPLGWTEPNKNSRRVLKEPRLYWHKDKFIKKNDITGKVSAEFREMDGIKNKVGLEIQFGKYPFMGYDIFSKMPIFHNAGVINCGIELVVTHSMTKNMSTGVSSFNQIKMDMIGRGAADIDLPTLIVGFECSKDEWEEVRRLRINFSCAINK